jgi:hypothetical protein
VSGVLSWADAGSAAAHKQNHKAGLRVFLRNPISILLCRLRFSIHRPHIIALSRRVLAVFASTLAPLRGIAAPMPDIRIDLPDKPTRPPMPAAFIPLFSFILA